VAVGSAIGNNACVSHDSPLPPEELINHLRRIADADDAPGTVQADARDHLHYLSGSGWITGEARSTLAATAAAQHRREVAQKVPRPRCGTS
jgi:hypothetical protein